MTAFKTITTSFLLAFAGFATASTINNLTPPTDYDNVGGILEWGQTFTSEGGAVSGVKVYIGDPTRPGVPSVNELTGPAELVLYEASSLLAPIELARNQVLGLGDSSSGIVSYLFAAAIPTTAGNTYFFAISAVDGYGIGLSSLISSTYAGGSQAWRDLGTGQITANSTGRDLSFEVATVPIPGTIWLFASSIMAGWGVLKKRT